TVNIAFGSASTTRPSTVMASGFSRRTRSSTGVAGAAERTGGLRYCCFFGKKAPPLIIDEFRYDGAGDLFPAPSSVLSTYTKPQSGRVDLGDRRRCRAARAARVTIAAIAIDRPRRIRAEGRFGGLAASGADRAMAAPRRARRRPLGVIASRGSLIALVSVGPCRPPRVTPVAPEKLSAAQLRFGFAESRQGTPRSAPGPGSGLVPRRGLGRAAGLTGAGRD